MNYKIAVLEDHPLIAASLKTILQQVPEVSEVHVFSDVKSFIVANETVMFDAGLIDINLGNDDGRDVVKKLSKSKQDFRSIVISSHDHPKVIQSAFKLGANAYLLKTADIEVIHDCIHKVLVEQMDYIPSDVQQILNAYMKGKKVYTSKNFPSLTNREMEVLQLISEEHTTKEIAEILNLSAFTIEGHRSNLFQKFDVKNLAGLIKKAIYAGLLD